MSEALPIIGHVTDHKIRSLRTIIYSLPCCLELNLYHTASHFTNIRWDLLHFKQISEDLFWILGCTERLARDFQFDVSGGYLLDKLLQSLSCRFSPSCGEQFSRL
ncbi:hypothetical protein GOP47_0015000 [Adiantum capillus-veneris]|uniref:Uncharacterized protein n=1 Tax=Adiantum capillus-veneris TaxID=13818 RepID=A0A9D4ZE16_ADICA|nr:hypothetical protein GOP47_0015000 [Adiantum capillus-veneris]